MFVCILAPLNDPVDGYMMIWYSIDFCSIYTYIIIKSVYLQTGYWMIQGYGKAIQYKGGISSVNVFVVQLFTMKKSKVGFTCGLLTIKHWIWRNLSKLTAGYWLLLKDRFGRLVVSILSLIFFPGNFSLYPYPWRSSDYTVHYSNPKSLANFLGKKRTKSSPFQGKVRKSHRRNSFNSSFCC